MTLEEILEAIKKNPALQGQIVSWAKDTTEGKEILENYSKIKVDEAIALKTSELHTSYDDDIFAILGERKANDQKSYDFVKKLVGELKELRGSAGKGEKAEKIKELEAEIKKMKDDGSHNEHWKKTFEEALEKWELKEKQLNDLIADKEKESLKSAVEADLTAGLAGIVFDKNIPKDVVDVMIASKKKEILENARVENGVVSYYDKDGKPLMSKDDFKPMTAEKFWSVELKSLIDVSSSSQQGGGGAPPTKKGTIVEIKGEGDTPTKKLVLDVSKFTTGKEFQIEANKTLREQGIDRSSKEFNKLKDEAYKEYKVSEMDRE